MIIFQFQFVRVFCWFWCLRLTLEFFSNYIFITHCSFLVIQAATRVCITTINIYVIRTNLPINMFYCYRVSLFCWFFFLPSFDSRFDWIYYDVFITVELQMNQKKKNCDQTISIFRLLSAIVFPFAISKTHKHTLQTKEKLGKFHLNRLGCVFSLSILVSFGFN